MQDWSDLSAFKPFLRQTRESREAFDQAAANYSGLHRERNEQIAHQVEQWLAAPDRPLTTHEAAEFFRRSLPSNAGLKPSLKEDIDRISDMIPKIFGAPLPTASRQSGDPKPEKP